jgi:urease accessory protein
MSGRDGFSAIETASTGRSARAELCFASGGGRTFLSRQNVPYPFHVTRTFHLENRRPDIATLYLQSASGGLYRNDDLSLDIVARAGAFAHVTTQAVTVVHDTGVLPARQRVALDAANGAFLAYTPDPLVLFPGATLRNETKLTIAPGARAIVADAFACHDPQDLARPFGALTQTLEIVDPSGRRLVREHGTLPGLDFLAEASPLGPFRAAGTMLILGPRETWPAVVSLSNACDRTGCLAGVTDLPNGVGRMLRCLARDGSDLRRGLDMAFTMAFETLVGVAPARRRK